MLLVIFHDLRRVLIIILRILYYLTQPLQNCWLGCFQFFSNVSNIEWFFLYCANINFQIQSIHIFLTLSGMSKIKKNIYNLICEYYISFKNISTSIHEIHYYVSWLFVIYIPFLLIMFIYCISYELRCQLFSVLKAFYFKAINLFFIKV